MKSYRKELWLKRSILFVQALPAAVALGLLYAAG